MEEKMNKSATSTGEVLSRFTHLSTRVLLLGILVSLPSTLPAIAQEGEVSLKSTAPIASSDVIRSIRDAAEAAETTAGPIVPAKDTLLPGAVSPQVIAKTFLATAYCLKGQTATG